MLTEVSYRKRWALEVKRGRCLYIGRGGPLVENREVYLVRKGWTQGVERGCDYRKGRTLWVKRGGVYTQS